MTIHGGCFTASAVKRTPLTVKRLRALLEDDVQNLSRMQETVVSSDGCCGVLSSSIDDHELQKVLDRNVVFGDDNIRSGRMYDIVDREDAF